MSCVDTFFFFLSLSAQPPLRGPASELAPRRQHLHLPGVPPGSPPLHQGKKKKHKQNKIISCKVLNPRVCRVTFSFSSFAQYGFVLVCVCVCAVLCCAMKMKKKSLSLHALTIVALVLCRDTCLRRSTARQRCFFFLYHMMRTRSSRLCCSAEDDDLF